MKTALKPSRTWSRLLPGILAFAALGLAIPAAQAQTAYVDSFGSITGDTFGTLDLQTGSFTAIGSFSNELYALGFGSNGMLYGLGPDRNTGTELFQVDTATGAETALQDFTTEGVDGGSMNSNGTFTAISLPDTSNRSSLFTVDPVAETLTPGAMTFADADGLAVDDGSGNVYVSDTNVTSSGYDGLDVVNTTAKHPGTAFIGDTGLYNLYTGFFSGGQLYTFGEDPNTSAEGVYTLNTDTGAATLVALTSNDQSIIDAALIPAAVPEASTTVSFGLLLACGALVVVAKRRKAVQPA